MKYASPIALLLATAIVLPCAGKDPILPTQINGATPLEWSTRMANSEMARRGENLAKGKWDYTAGLFTLSLLKLNEQAPNAAYVPFATNAIGSFIAPDGSIRGYKASEYQLDALNPGKTVLALWQLTHDDRYEKAAALLRKQLDTQPRTSDGGFWHKERYTNQMWLDGLYMGAPFYAEYTKLFNGPATNYDDIANQFKLVRKHLYDKQAGLYYHGWDSKKTQAWANPATGTSSNFWGRGLGWYAMALVDTLDYFPTNHAGYKELTSQLRHVADGLVKWQDTNGLWWQVLDQGGRAGNYEEATASSMFVYSLAKGVNKGYLPKKYIPAILKGYTGITGKLIKQDGDKISLTQCCSVAGLGFGRDGSFNYYIHEPVVENDLKGVGPFILAGIQLQDLLGVKSPSAVAVDEKAAAAAAKDVAKQWKVMDEILARIHEPKFPNRKFPITDFGAAPGGQVDCTAAIHNAIDACHEAGGGHVIVPAGEFLTGPIVLKSGVDLHLETNSVLKFTTNTAAYLPAVLTRFEGMECYNYSPLIYAWEQENIAVTGSGTLDGQADDTTWWSWKGRKTGDLTQTQVPARKRLDQMVNDNVPVEQRRFGQGDNLRPSFFEPQRSRNVLIEGVHIRRSPMWELHPLLCTNVIVRGVDIVSHGPNNDGCDPECCTDVLMENTLFDTGDDCIAIKSGRNNDGRRVGIASENIVIRGCTMKDGHGGVTMGSEISGGCRNVFAENCDMDSPNLDRVLRFKSNAVRGGVVENVYMRNVKVGRVADAAIQIDFAYEEGANGPFKPVVRNVVMENVTVAQTPRVLNIVGVPTGEISNVRVINCTFHNVAKPDIIKEASGVELIGCQVERPSAE